MIRLIGIVVTVAALIIGGLVFVDGLKKSAYSAGYDKASLEYVGHMSRLKNVVERMNQEALVLKQRQMESYRIALDMRNAEYSKIDNELKQKLKELEEVQDELAKDWYNTPIPDVYRRM